MADFPEHQKMKLISNQSQTIGSFLDWLNLKGYLICEYINDDLVRVPWGIEKGLAEYFDIDLEKIEEEKRQMIDELRAANQKKGEEK